MRFLVSALGSAGDVYPFIAVAKSLRSRGHAVRLLAAPPFAARVRAAGIDFVPLGAEGEFERLVQRAELWQPLAGARLLVGELLQRLPEAYAATAAAAAGCDVLVGSTLSWSVRLLQETRGLPAATVHLSPACLPSAVRPAVLPGAGDPSWLPPSALRALQWAAERFVIDPWLAPRLDAFRATLALPPARRIVGRWMHSPELVVGAWPEWFAPSPTDWPAQTRICGFPLLDETGAAADAAGDAALDAFLDAGAAPVGITPGSAMAHGEAFFAKALGACRALGARAVIVTPYRDQLPAVLPRDVHQVAYVPFGRLLPRLAALVHHGGIGTSARALAAGLPQLAVPFAHDQFDNAARLRRLGVAASPRLGDGDALWAAALQRLLRSPDVAEAARRCASRMHDGEPPALLVARALEALGASHGGPTIGDPAR